MISIAVEKVRAARLAAGFRFIRNAVEATGLNYKTLLAFEGRSGLRPPRAPSLDALRALARAYGCHPRDFAKDPTEWDRAVAAQAATLESLALSVTATVIEPSAQAVG